MLVALLVLLQFCVPPPPQTTLPGPVTRGFVAPTCPRCAGHRGVTVSVNGPVRALLDGVVTFDGEVAGRRYLVMRVGPGLRLTYGGLLGDRWGVGLHIPRGATIGAATGSLYLGVRRGTVPVDPTLLLARSGPRLVPPARLACPEQPLWPAEQPR